MDIEAGGKEYQSQVYPGILFEALQSSEIPSPHVEKRQRALISEEVVFSMR